MSQCLQDPDLQRGAEEKIGVAEHVSLDDMGSDLLRQADQKMGDVEVGYRFYHPIFVLSEGPSLSSAQMMEEMFRLRLKWSGYYREGEPMTPVKDLLQQCGWLSVGLLS